jgi:hypothetical protein
MKNGARIVSLSFLIVILGIPNSDNSLPCVSIVLELFHGKIILTVSSSAVRTMEHPVVFGVVLKLWTYSNNRLRSAYSTKKLTSLYGANPRHRTASYTERERGKDVVDVNNRIFNLKGVEPTRSCGFAVS